MSGQGGTSYISPGDRGHRRGIAPEIRNDGGRAAGRRARRRRRRRPRPRTATATARAVRRPSPERLDGQRSRRSGGRCLRCRTSAGGGGARGGGGGAGRGGRPTARAGTAGTAGTTGTGTGAAERHRDESVLAAVGDAVRGEGHHVAAGRGAVHGPSVAVGVLRLHGERDREGPGGGHLGLPAAAAAPVHPHGGREGVGVAVEAARRGPKTTYTPNPLLRAASNPEPETVTDWPPGARFAVCETRSDAARAGAATATGPMPAAATATTEPRMRWHRLTLISP